MVRYNYSHHWMIALLLLILSRAGLAQTGFAQECEVKEPLKCLGSARWESVSQLGVAYEQHNNYALAYLFWDQLINKHWYYEVRVAGIRDWIVSDPPKDSISVKDERNLWGLGGVWIFGYVFEVCPSIKIMPFYRGQVMSNVASNYKDTFHNEKKSVSWTQYGGLNVALNVTKELSLYIRWFGGYRTIEYTGEKFWRHPKHVNVNAFASSFEFGAPFKFKCPSLCDSSFVITPYAQYNLVVNNPSKKALEDPWHLSGLTNYYIVFATKFAYEF